MVSNKNIAVRMFIIAVTTIAVARGDCYSSQGSCRGFATDQHLYLPSTPLVDERKSSISEPYRDVTATL